MHTSKTIMQTLINKMYCIFSIKIILIVHKSVMFSIIWRIKTKTKKCTTKVFKPNWFNNNNNHSNNYNCNNSNKCEFVFSQSLEFCLRQLLGKMFKHLTQSTNKILYIYKVLSYNYKYCFVLCKHYRYTIYL